MCLSAAATSKKMTNNNALISDNSPLAISEVTLKAFSPSEDFMCFSVN